MRLQVDFISFHAMHTSDDSTNIGEEVEEGRSLLHEANLMGDRKGRGTRRGKGNTEGTKTRK